jgi:hypothetical protein
MQRYRPNKLLAWVVSRIHIGELKGALTVHLHYSLL